MYALVKDDEKIASVVFELSSDGNLIETEREYTQKLLEEFTTITI